MAKITINTDRQKIKYSGYRTDIMYGITVLLKELQEDGVLDNDAINYIAKITTASQEELREMLDEAFSNVLKTVDEALSELKKIKKEGGKENVTRKSTKTSKDTKRKSK